MKKSEREARDKLAQMRVPLVDRNGRTVGTDAYVVDKHGGRHVDNHDVATVKDGLLRRALKLPPRGAR